MIKTVRIKRGLRAVKIGHWRLQDSVTEAINTPAGKIYVTINYDVVNIPKAVFINGNFGVYDENFNKAEAAREAIRAAMGSASAGVLGRMISCMLRSGIDGWEVVKILENVSCGTSVWDDGVCVKSVEDGVGKVLKRFMGIGIRKGN